MKNINTLVCPVALSGSLDNRIRRWLQNPRKIIEPYINEGMTVLDMGCGPGFFTIEMAMMVGRSGRVIAADMQEGMLRKVKEKIAGTELEKRVLLHKCEEDRIGVTLPVDFVLLFYMVHEVPDKQHLFKEIHTILIRGGQVMIVEPPVHVSKSAFEETVRIAEDAGFAVVERPKVFFSRGVVLKKG
ncbi:MAG: methyltransferase domain-containing protein [Chlorobiaceae bacterium]|nr:methyltransferase domain-containing protein [Chlorobiaceae bacterium]